MNTETATVAKYKNINNMKLSGVFKKTYDDQAKITGSGTADIYLADKTSKEPVSKIGTQTFTITDAAAGYTIEDLPQYCYI